MSDGQIDWSAIHRRLKETSVALDKGFSPSAEDRKKILKARADLLSRKADRELDDDRIEVVEFMLAGERYALESSYVREVHPLREYTPLPCTPAFVLGLINVRGQIISVIDIKRFFELPEKGISDLNKIIIVHHQSMEFGILADSIVGVRSILRNDLQPSLPTLRAIHEDYLMGITGDRMIILDAKKILMDRNIIVHEEG